MFFANFLFVMCNITKYAKVLPFSCIDRQVDVLVSLGLVRFCLKIKKVLLQCGTARNVLFKRKLVLCETTGKKCSCLDVVRKGLGTTTVSSVFKNVLFWFCHLPVEHFKYGLLKGMLMLTSRKKRL